MGPLRRPSIRHAFRFNPALQVASLGLLSTLFFAVPAHAAAADEVMPTAEAVAQLELQASQAKPREQCFLYTELIHTMTEKAGREIADGNTEQAAATLKKVNQYARLVHVNLAKDAKRLKDAEELMHNTTYRLASSSTSSPATTRRTSRKPSSSWTRSTTNSSPRSSATRWPNLVEMLRKMSRYKVPSSRPETYARSQLADDNEIPMRAL
jgi:hypothetical protein